MSLKNSSIVLGVIFCESEHRVTPSAGRVYHYFVPQAIIDDGYQPKQGGYVTIPGGDGRTALGRIETISDTTTVRTKATKAILGIVDMGHTEREQQRVKRTREIMEALTEMDERRKQRLRFDELAKDNVAAGALLTELDALQNG